MASTPQQPSVARAAVSGGGAPTPIPQLAVSCEYDQKSNMWTLRLLGAWKQVRYLEITERPDLAAGRGVKSIPEFKGDGASLIVRWAIGTYTGSAWVRPLDASYTPISCEWSHMLEYGVGDVDDKMAVTKPFPGNWIRVHNVVSIVR